MGLDFEKVLRENLSEGAFAVVASSETEFADWICRVKQQSVRCDEMYDELKRYKDAEKQGLLKMLPCRVGDTVYVATRTLNKRRGFYGEKKMIFEDTPIPEYVECKVVGISFKNKGNFIKVRYTGKFEEKYFDDETGYDYRIITDSVDKNYVFSSIGEMVFLTEEAALAEKGGAE